VRFDVLVLGAGPAGNLAAQRLASSGHSVCVIDWRQNIGDKLCTGIIGRECMERYGADLADVYHEARSAVLVSPSGKRFPVSNPNPQAYIIDRVAFVASLARKAQRAGAVYRLGPRVVDIQIDGTGVTVYTKHGAVLETVKGSLAIVASGFSSPLVSIAGLANGGHLDAMLGCQAEVEAPGLTETEIYLGDTIAPGSFGWLVPLAESRALAGIVTRQKLNGHMGHFMENLLRTGRIRSVIKRSQSWGVPVKPLPRTYATRVLVAGDAAGLAKPTTGGGIYYALLSGDIAAQTAHEAIVEGDFSARKLKGYEKGWKAVLGSELRVGYIARVLYEYLGDQRVESLVEKMASLEVQGDLIGSSDFAFDRHSGVIKKAIAHQVLGKFFTSIGNGTGPLLSGITGQKRSQP